MTTPSNDTGHLNKLPRLIGLGYRARAGKNTVADILETNFDYDQLSFAFTLRHMVSTLLDTNTYDEDFKTEVWINGKTGRQVLLEMGTFCRSAFGPDVFVQALKAQLTRCGMWEPQSKVRAVITDVRFPNEAKFIKDHGGILIEVRRPGLPEDNDPTETGGAAIKWDHTIVNAGTLDALEIMVAQLLAAICMPAAELDTPPTTPATA